MVKVGVRGPVGVGVGLKVGVEGSLGLGWG